MLVDTRDMCVALLTLAPSPQNYVSTSCYPKPTFEPFAYGAAYVISGDLLDFFVTNHAALSQDLIRDGDEGVCCDLDDVQISMWLKEYRHVTISHDGNVNGAMNCHDNSYAVCDVDVELMEAAFLEGKVCGDAVSEWMLSRSRKGGKVNDVLVRLIALRRYGEALELVDSSASTDPLFKRNAVALRPFILGCLGEARQCAELRQIMDNSMRRITESIQTPDY